jgi:hypothetical protein
MIALARGRGAGTLAIVGLYALLVMGAPLLHHDFACHQKSPTHCVACVSSPSALRATAKVAVAPALRELGPIVDAGRRQLAARPLLPLPGRSPPA